MVQENRVFVKGKVKTFFTLCALAMIGLFLHLGYLMIVRGGYYTEKAIELHERERNIKAYRGLILDRNGVVLADNISVCTVSVIYNQMEDREAVIRMLCEELDLSEEYVRKRVEKRSSMERIKTNVSKEIGEKIRSYEMAGVKVDEDYKRYYPYGELASKVLGFTGADNQGIIGLEVTYEEVLAGEMGQILTMTDAKGVEVEAKGERRREAVPGDNLITTLDINIQSYATQLAKQALENKSAESVSIIVMHPKTGEIYAMVNVPEFDLNDPFTLPEGMEAEGTKQQDALNKMWRNGCINDTYEPGSTFKIITAASALEEGTVTRDSGFHCPGYVIVEDRRIRCHKTTGHGSQTFLQGTMNSCNPCFVNVGLGLGVDRLYKYMERFGIMEKTGVDLPGEAGSIMHNKENVGPVELACISFGQSFQITPLRLLSSVSTIVNGGYEITPHFAKAVIEETGDTVPIAYEPGEQVVSTETSEELRYFMEMVVAEGGGKNGAVEGVRVGGKTATSQTLPRSARQYIASFIGMAPADDPQVIAIAIVNKPTGMYYGAQVAAPIVRQLFENILPYLGIMDYNAIE